MNTAPAYPSARARRTGAATDGQQSDGPPRVAASSAAAGRPRASGSALPSPIRVVNKHAASREEKERAAYVGRGSALGNPFKVKPYGPHERGTTLPLYEDHLRGRLAQKHRPTCDEMNRLYARARKAQAEGSELLLMCFCAPKPCHADVVKKVLDEQLSARQNSAASGFHQAPTALASAR